MTSGIPISDEGFSEYLETREQITQLMEAAAEIDPSRDLYSANGKTTTLQDAARNLRENTSEGKLFWRLILQVAARRVARELAQHRERSEEPQR